MSVIKTHQLSEGNIVLCEEGFSCYITHLEAVFLLRSTTQKQLRHVLQSFWLTLAFGMPRPGSRSLWDFFFFLKNDERPTSQLIPATKKKTYLFSKIPNYERQNLAGRCALLSLSWLLFAWGLSASRYPRCDRNTFYNCNDKQAKSCDGVTFSTPL